MSCVNSKPQYSLHLKSFWTEYELKASTNVGAVILLQVYKQLSSFGSTVMCVAICSKYTHARKITCLFRNISVVFLKSTTPKIFSLMNRLVSWSATLMVCICTAVSTNTKTNHGSFDGTAWNASGREQLAIVIKLDNFNLIEALSEDRVGDEKQTSKWNGCCTLWIFIDPSWHKGTEGIRRGDKFKPMWVKRSCCNFATHPGRHKSSLCLLQTSTTSLVFGSEVSPSNLVTWQKANLLKEWTAFFLLLGVFCWISELHRLSMGLDEP